MAMCYLVLGKGKPEPKDKNQFLVTLRERGWGEINNGDIAKNRFWWAEEA